MKYIIILLSLYGSTSFAGETVADSKILKYMSVKSFYDLDLKDNEHIVAQVGNALNDHFDKEFKNEKEYFEQVKKLPRALQVYVFTSILIGEVKNGGFSQFYWNRNYEGFYEESILSLKEIGAHKLSEICKEVKDYYDSNKKKNKELSDEEFSSKFMYSQVLNKELNDVHKRFFKEAKSFEKLLGAYFIKIYKELKKSKG